MKARAPSSSRRDTRSASSGRGRSRSSRRRPRTCRRTRSTRAIKCWLERQRARVTRRRAHESGGRTAATYTPVISVVTPVYNTDEAWLTKVHRVGARADLSALGAVPRQRRLDPTPRQGHPRRVRSRPSRESAWSISRAIQGIAGASGRGLELASGDFVALLDHDDELPPEALFEVAKRLNDDPDLDLIYTDEDKIEMDGRRIEPFFKPDWSPDLLLSMNYITHLSVFRRSLLAEIGGLPATGSTAARTTTSSCASRSAPSASGTSPRCSTTGARSPAPSPPPARPSRTPTRRPAQSHRGLARGAAAATVRSRSYRPGRYSVRYRLRATPLVSDHHPDAGSMVAAAAVPPQPRGEDHVHPVRDHRPRQ